MSFALPFIPQRIRGVELFDDPRLDAALAVHSLTDIALANRLFGGTSAVMAELRPLFLAAREARRPLTLLDVGSGAGDALALPFASRNVDVVTCSQVLHHFADGAAQTLIAELHRVARLGVIIAELRRSWAAAGGLWLASFVLGFHPVSRHDGVVSVLRGYRAAELGEAVHRSTAQHATVRNRRGFRVTASWRPD